ncbi:MAG TPA: tetratricopeptide repeat protein [Cyclobacteriaceae bacterium]|nr:tetratricopeptide repeat protein [Cyclobacteriaceae bacterium]
MKSLLVLSFFLASLSLFAQTGDSEFNGNHWGVVLETAAMNDVVVKKDITYFKDDKVELKIDLHLPPRLKPGEKLPVIVFMNGFGDNRMRNNGVYRSWPKLVATHGFIGVSMDSDGERLTESYNAMFDFLGKQDHIDGNRIGVYAASANGRYVLPYLMSPAAHPGIRAAAIYYAETPKAPYRKDLPVYFIATELDARHMDYTALWKNVLDSNAPWTIAFAATMPHAFDAFTDNEISKKYILETLSFWKTHLTPLPVTSSKPEMAREIVAMTYQGNYDRVIELMTQWMKEHPNSKDAGAYRMLGDAYMKKKRFAESAEVYNKAIALEPENRGAMLNMVIISYALDKRSDALRWLDAYEKDQKKEGFTYGYIGRAVLGMNKIDEAMSYFERSIELGPHPSDYYNLAK